MAASTRAITPTHTGPFSAPNGPSTPASTARNPHGAATFGTHLTKSPRGLSPRHSPQPLTGAAALADERRYREQSARQTTPNPAVATLQTLAGNSQSRPSDAPQGTAPMSSQVDKTTKPLVIPELTGVAGDNMQTSPVSLSSFGDGDSSSAPGAPSVEATAGPAGNAGQEGAPQQPQHHQQHHHQLIAPNPGDNPGNRAFTFPGPRPPEPDPRAPARQMSLPGYGQNTPKSPSTKRHKCPYCSTDFTRHHNLKSHLLTHSQEKPYECPTCQARFRRLHDLKRHTKLHTGERPHTCFKCGRRFARGDALARHNKGQGGCAGRRSSFGMDEDLGDGKGDDMDGVMYTGDGEGDDDDDGGRRESEPARKRQNTGNSTQSSYHQHSSTYPPIAANRSSNGQNNLRPYYPASSTQPTNISPKLAPSSISSLHSANPSNVFAQGGMTESPKPLSPGQQEQHRLGATEGSLHGSRSPNVSQHMHQQNFARSRGTPPMGLAPPPANSGPHLPSLPGLNPMAPKQGSQGGKASNLNMLQHQQMAAPGTASQPGSMSSHGGSGSSMREVMGNQVDVWQYVREIESRMARMEKEHNERISTLQNEITTLRAQLAQQHVNNTQTHQQGQ
ncbi:Nn.00g100210.m01.CDS01 [Neocucurbitaria sp. VM-36]